MTIPPFSTEAASLCNTESDIFKAACKMLAPYITKNDDTKTMSDFAMAHMIHDHFPELSQEDVYLVITTVEQAYKLERLQEILGEDYSKGW